MRAESSHIWKDALTGNWGAGNKWLSCVAFSLLFFLMERAKDPSGNDFGTLLAEKCIPMNPFSLMEI